MKDESVKTIRDQVVVFLPYRITGVGRALMSILTRSVSEGADPRTLRNRAPIPSLARRVGMGMHGHSQAGFSLPDSFALTLPMRC